MFRLLCLAIVATGFTMTAQADPLDVFGTFLTQKGNSHVTIADCGDSSPCGTVAWIDPASMPDGLTPDAARTKSGKPVLGLLMLEGFERQKKDWRGGTIYDPERDKTFASRLKRLENGDLQVKGCVGPVCQTQVWTEVTAIETSASD